MACNHPPASGGGGEGVKNFIKVFAGERWSDIFVLWWVGSGGGLYCWGRGGGHVILNLKLKLHNPLASIPY